MVYVSSIEQNSDNDEEYQKRNLLISEAVINRVMLNQEMPKIEYIYPHINPKGYVVMYLNWQTGSKITVTINIENSEYKIITISKSQYIIIPENEIRLKKYCPYLATKPNQVCSIVVQIKLDSNFYNDEPILEFSIKSQEIVPAFIRKSMLRKDIILERFVSQSPADMLIAPKWGLKNHEFANLLHNYLCQKNIYQGAHHPDGAFIPVEQ